MSEVNSGTGNRKLETARRRRARQHVFGSFPKSRAEGDRQNGAPFCGPSNVATFDWRPFNKKGPRPAANAWHWFSSKPYKIMHVYVGILQRFYLKVAETFNHKTRKSEKHLWKEQVRYRACHQSSLVSLQFQVPLILFHVL